MIHMQNIHKSLDDGYIHMHCYRDNSKSEIYELVLDNNYAIVQCERKIGIYERMAAAKLCRYVEENKELPEELMAYWY